MKKLFFCLCLVILGFGAFQANATEIIDFSQLGPDNSFGSKIDYEGDGIFD